MLNFSFHLLCYTLLAIRTDRGYLPMTPSICRAMAALVDLGLATWRDSCTPAVDITPFGEAMAQALLITLPKGAPNFYAASNPWRCDWFRSKVW